MVWRWNDKSLFVKPKAVNLPKPTEVVDTTLRLGPAAQASLSVVNKLYLRKSCTDPSQGILRRPRRDVSISSILQEQEDDTTVTLSENAVTIAPVAPAIFSSNQLRSPVLSSSGRSTI
jgi:hypothetical protein